MASSQNPTNHENIPSRPEPSNREAGRRAAHWYAGVLGFVIAVLGVLLAGGGVWLIMLGGSWYYAIAGIGLVISGLYLMQPSMVGVWVYLLTYVFTVIWALWEVGFDWWAQVPRIVAPTVLLIPVLLAIPAINRVVGRTGVETRHRHAAATASIALLAGLGALLMVHGVSPVVAQEANDTASQQPAQSQTTEPSDDASKPLNSQLDQPASAAPDQPLTGEAAQDQTTQAQDDQQNAAGAEKAAAYMATGEVGDDWPAYGGTNHATRYSPLDQINRDNVSDLKRIWDFHTGDLPSKEAKGKYSPENTPIKVGQYLYMCSPKNKLISVHAETGKERWVYDPEVPDDAIPYGATCRGVAYYADPAANPDDPCATRILEGTLDARLIAVDARTGQKCSDFGANGEVSLLKGIGKSVPGWYGNVAAPVIVRNVIVLGAQVLDGQAEDAPSGVIRGYNAVTGKLEWAWDMCKPQLTGEPPEGETYTRGTPNMWTSAAGDNDLGLVFIPLGNSAVDYYGGNRLDCENEYSSSLVALDVTTGKEAWHFQTVHYDVWDYDLGSQPTLVDDFPTDDGPVPAVILPSKQGEIYVLDRRTGKSLFPVEERDVPTNAGVEQENLSPTQPFSDYASVAKPRLTERDMWGMSPLDQLWCRIQFHQATYLGEYTPPTLDTRYIEYPGYNGGSDWGSVAVDAKDGILIANYNDMPNFNRLLTRKEADERGLTPITNPLGKHDNAQAGSPYAVTVNAGWRNSFTGLMCKEPPYGNIRAIDLKTGKTLWDVPLGTARANGPFGIPSMLPFKIGTPNNGGPIITAGGLVFVAAATDGLIRAIDVKTGKTVWSDTLPAGGQATPMTFEAGGRQFVALMAAGHHFMETPIGDSVIAWALPKDEVTGKSTQ